jgi:hypothetical protein
MFSTDAGLTWTTITVPGTAGGIFGMTYDGPAGGKLFVTTGTRIKWSPDLVSWSEHNPGFTTIRPGFVSASNEFLFVNQSFTGTSAIATVDFVSWKPFVLPAGPQTNNFDPSVGPAYDQRYICNLNSKDAMAIYSTSDSFQIVTKRFSGITPSVQKFLPSIKTAIAAGPGARAVIKSTWDT